MLQLHQHVDVHLVLLMNGREVRGSQLAISDLSVQAFSNLERLLDERLCSDEIGAMTLEFGEVNERQGFTLPITNVTHE